MNENLREVLLALLNEIEDIRAHQVVTTVALSVLPDFSQTDFQKLKTDALHKNAESYTALRQTISKL